MQRASSGEIHRERVPTFGALDLPGPVLTAEGALGGSRLQQPPHLLRVGVYEWRL